MILGVETLTLRRRAAGTRGTDGRFTPGAETVSTIRGSVQPPPRQVLETLSEGERQRGAKVVFTRAELRTGDQNTGTLADVLEYVGAQWEVRDVQRWPALLPHYEVIVVRVKEAG